MPRLAPSIVLVAGLTCLVTGAWWLAPWLGMAAAGLLVSALGLGLHLLQKDRP